NFADNVFAIGQSNVDAAFRYVKHIKPRSTELVYDTSNVLVGEIRKWEKNFLGFRFTHFGDETAHLSRSISGIRKERVEVVAAMSGRGMSQREIARELGISASSVNRYLQISRDEDDYDFDDGFYPEEDKAEEAPAETNLEGGPWWQLEKDPVLRHKAYMMRYKLGPYAEEGAAHEKPNAVYDDEYEEDDNGDDDDDDPMARYGLTSEDDAHDSQLMTHDSSDGVVLSHNSQLTTHNSSDKIEIGDIVLTRSGQLKRKTLWGWDASVEGVESG
ncbi:MAG TPA: winged helix-turn-helix transcriptional regulator, partial [Pyrinomonadaceae bacterium]|nr:winged helix-turn-helix transcriptional regulator [Pyrinomonadaceae bacterium]